MAGIATQGSQRTHLAVDLARRQRREPQVYLRCDPPGWIPSAHCGRAGGSCSTHTRLPRTQARPAGAAAAHLAHFADLRRRLYPKLVHLADRAKWRNVVLWGIKGY